MSKGPIVDRLGNETREDVKRFPEVGGVLTETTVSLRRLYEACLLCICDFAVLEASDEDVDSMSKEYIIGGQNKLECYQTEH